MYAVVRTGGKQYRVAIGSHIKVDRLDCETGASINFDEVLMVGQGEKAEMGAPTLDTRVSATVVSHGRGEKIKVFKMRRRKNYRRTQGHRQDFTELKITAIGDLTEADMPKPVKPAKAAKPKAPAKAPVKEPAQKAADSTETESKATTKKAAKKKAAKPAAAKKKVAKKTAAKKKTAKKKVAKSKAKKAKTSK